MRAGSRDPVQVAAAREHVHQTLEEEKLAIVTPRFGTSADVE